MKVTVLGATGRTGAPLVERLRAGGHVVTAVVRDPSRAPEGVRAVIGDVRDRQVLAQALAGADAVVSALGLRGRDDDLHRALVAQLIPVLREVGVRRYIGVGGAGTDVPGDRKRPRDRVISRVMRPFGGPVVADKAAELAAWRDSDLDWTVVRPPRLVDGPATSRTEHDAHVSTRSTRMHRADLAAFLVEVLEQGLYVRRAPFAATVP